MSDTGSIAGIGSSDAAARAGRIASNGYQPRGGDAPTDHRRVRESDSVSLSDAARAAARPEDTAVPPPPNDPARAELVRQVKEEIDAGVYDTDAWLDRAVDGLILDISQDLSQSPADADQI